MEKDPPALQQQQQQEQQPAGAGTVVAHAIAPDILPTASTEADAIDASTIDAGDLDEWGD